MAHLRRGILGLAGYDPKTKEWSQARAQGAFVFAMWIFKNQKSKILDFEILTKKSKNSSFSIKLDKKLLISEGKDLIKQLLVVL